MEFLIQGHFDEDPDRAMTRADSAEWDAIAVDSAKKASDTRELLQLKKKEDDELRANTNAVAIPETPKPTQTLAQAAIHDIVDSPIDDVFRAFGGETDEAIPDVPSEFCLYVRKLLTLANDHEIRKGASFDVPHDTNALCRRMTNEVHKDVLS